MNKVAGGGKQGPPHWAGASILRRKLAGAVIEVSWLVAVGACEEERKGLESKYCSHHWYRGTTQNVSSFLITAGRILFAAAVRCLQLCLGRYEC